MADDERLAHVLDRVQERAEDEGLDRSDPFYAVRLVELTVDVVDDLDAEAEAESEDLPDEVQEDLDAPEPEDQERAESERSDRDEEVSESERGDSEAEDQDRRGRPRKEIPEEAVEAIEDGRPVNDVAAEYDDITRYTLYNRIKEGEIEQPDTYSCKFCGEEFSSSYALRTHEGECEEDTDGQEPEASPESEDDKDDEEPDAEEEPEPEPGESDEGGEDEETFACPDCGKEFDKLQYRNVHRAKSKSCGEDAEQPHEDAEPGEDDLTKVERRARRIEDAMAGEGWMETGEILEEADIERSTAFHNARKRSDRLARMESKPKGEGTAKLYRIPSDDPGSDESEPEADGDASDTTGAEADETDSGGGDEDADGEFECRYCSRTFKTERKRSGHETTAHGRSPDREAEEFRHNESTVLEVAKANVAGEYLCCDCGKTFSTSDAAVRHESEEHLPEGERVRTTPEDELEDRYVIIYQDVGGNWTHPKEHEGKKRRIERTLTEADYFLDERELREETEFSRDELESLLEELVEEGRVEQDQETWGVPS